MKKNINNVIIVAGGAGNRFENDIPKQFVLLNEIRMIDYSINTFKNHKNIDNIIIVCHADWLETIKKENPTCIVTEGGKTRKESCYNGLIMCDDEVENILIHDAARPFVNKRIISECISALSEYQACSPFIKLNDSVIFKESNKYKKLDREALFCMQTPQGFKRNILKKILSVKSNDTDEIGTYLDMYPNNPPYLYEGTKENFKVTLKEDIIHAKNCLLK